MLHYAAGSMDSDCFLEESDNPDLALQCKPMGAIINLGIAQKCPKVL